MEIRKIFEKDKGLRSIRIDKNYVYKMYNEHNIKLMTHEELIEELKCGSEQE